MRPQTCLLAGLLLLVAPSVQAQQAGGIRGTVYDQDFGVPLAAAKVQIIETGETVTTTEDGNYAFAQVQPGTYTVVFSKEGYTRLVRADVVVSPGSMTELDAWLAGSFTEMDEFVVQDLQLGAGTEIGLLELRMDSPALMDSISADLISRAGASDAAGALKLVAGASVQDGKYAVIRGLPDRYVNSQMNGVRLPTADADKRAVQLDQFPAAAVESIQVSKSFTPDQQGDASGGAVNVVLKSIPDETVFRVGFGTSYNTAVVQADRFLTSEDGGVGDWGSERRHIQADRLGKSWDGAVGVSSGDEPTDYKWSVEAGGKHELDSGIRIGALGNLFYERDSSFFDDGINDSYWVETPGAAMTPQYSQGSPSQGEFKTSLFDVTQGGEEVKWSGLGVLGLETENHTFSLTGFHTQVAEDVATLAEDTRGKAYYFPGYDADDPSHPGNQERDAAPYLRTETLEYTERTTDTLQLRGRHTLFDPEVRIPRFFSLLRPEADWGMSHSEATLYQPDKRQFGSMWWAASYNPGFPPYIPPFTSPPVHRPFKPAANFTMGNLQRVWKDIAEESDQFYFNLKLPFEQWTEDEGYFKFGVFHDSVDRQYDQESFSNFNDNRSSYEGRFGDFWSRKFPSEDHPITAAEIDVDYEGEQNIRAWYCAADVPLTHSWKILGGARVEETEILMTNNPEKDVTWIPPGSPSAVVLRPGDADVSFQQTDVLPSIGLVYTPAEQVALRASYSETIARQTFKELSPIQQQEYLGGDVFIGNPLLRMSALRNYDLRLDYTPYPGSLVSLSYFRKDIKDPIEYVQRIADFAYTTPINYPEGEINGVELEIRQELGRFWQQLEGLSLGANATLIDSEVTLPPEEAAQFDQPNINAPMRTRDMMNAPEHLYNLFATYELDRLGLTDTELALFYTVQGDTLVAGAGQSKGHLVPDVYATEYGTFNLSLSKTVRDRYKFTFQAKNLTDPAIRTVYRSDYIDGDVTKTSYHKGRDFSLSLIARF